MQMYMAPQSIVMLEPAQLSRMHHRPGTMFEHQLWSLSMLYLIIPAIVNTVGEDGTRNEPPGE